MNNVTVKHITELQRGDIIRVEYGDFDNWVSVVFESFEYGERWIRIKWHSIGDSESCNMYGSDTELYYDVIGKEE